MNVQNILVSVATSFIVVVVAALTGLVGGNDVNLGGSTRFPNSDLSAKSLEATSGNLTASGNVDVSGEASQFGSANTANYLYIGAGDGCAAVYFSASTTQTVQATSTSFCNS